METILGHQSGGIGHAVTMRKQTQRVLVVLVLVKPPVTPAGEVRKVQGELEQ